MPAEYTRMDTGAIPQRCIVISTSIDLNKVQLPPDGLERFAILVLKAV